MGNEQSLPAARRSANRLSKPRTSSYPTANLLSSKSAPPTRRSSVATHPDALTPTQPRPAEIPPATTATTATTADQDAEPKKRRRSLFRSKSVQPKREVPEEIGDEREAVEQTLLEKLQSRRWSRASILRRDSSTLDSGSEGGLEASMETAPPLPRKRTSLSQPFATHSLRLPNVAELPTPGPERDGFGESDARGEQGEARESSMGARTSSDTQLYVPMRRRSLLQHGVATRARSPWPLRVEGVQSYYHNPSTPMESPFAELAALQRSPESPTPAVEAIEMDYRHIGAFKLGTLRIVNGDASPEPSPRRAATMGQDQDYLSFGGMRRSLERDRHPKLCARSNTISVPAESHKASWVVRDQSLHRHGVEALSPDQDVSPRHPRAVRNPVTADPPDAELATLALSELGDSEHFQRNDSPVKSLKLAHEDQRDLARSPFSFDRSPSASPTLVATSKHMAVEDDLFSSAPSTPDLSARFPRSFDSGTENISVSKTPGKIIQGPRDLTPKPLAKADSGYRSNVSVRSFKKESAPTSPLDDPPTPPPKDHLPFVQSGQCETALRTRRSLAALPAEGPAAPHLVSTTHGYRCESMPTTPARTDKTSNSRPLTSSSPLRWPAPKAKRSQSVQPSPSEARHKPEHRVLALPVGSTDVRKALSFARLQGSLPAIPRGGTIHEHQSTHLFGNDGQDQHEHGLRQQHNTQHRIMPRPDHNRRRTYQAPFPAQPYRDSYAHCASVPHRYAQQGSGFCYQEINRTSSALGNPAYDAMLAIRHPRSEARQRDDPPARAMSMTAQFDARATTGFAGQYTSNDHQEMRLRTRRSHGSISLCLTSSNENMNRRLGTAEGRGRTEPQPSHAHGRQRSMPGLQQTSGFRNIPLPNRTPAFDDDHLSSLTTRSKSPPPVAMMTQRKGSLREQGHRHLPVESFTRPDFEGQNSVDAFTRPERSSSLANYRTSQATEGNGWNVGVGYEYEHDLARGEGPPIWVDGATLPLSTAPRPHSRHQDPNKQQEYNHRYGLPVFAPYGEDNFYQAEYYDSSAPQQRDHLSETFHRRQTSTSDMLVLDCYPGGSDFGYEAEYGLGGSASTRNTGRVAAGHRKSVSACETYGADFSDVPVLLQQIPPIRG